MDCELLDTRSSCELLNTCLPVLPQWLAIMPKSSQLLCVSRSLQFV